MDHLNEIDRIFKKYATDYHFYLRDLVNNKEYELGVKKNYPICSCFKLAVLMAFFDSLESESQLDEEVVIQPEDFSPGVGILNYGKSAFKATYFQLAQMMMSFSDGTATDILMKKIEISQINIIIKNGRPHTRITKNLKEMVNEFQRHHLISNLRDNPNKQYTFEDTSNAIELSSLATDAFQFIPKRISREKYLECLDTKKLLGRTALYFGQEIKAVGKTGSFGYGFFANDCGVLVQNDKAVGSFGITSQGFVVDKDIVEIIFGLIGLKLIDLIGLSHTPNVRYSERTRRLLEI